MADTKTPDRRGPRGPKGKPGAPGVKPDAIDAMTHDIEELQDEAAIQFKRTAQIQVQLDETLKALKEMGDSAGRQRKKKKKKKAPAKRGA